MTQTLLFQFCLFLVFLPGTAAAMFQDADSDTTVQSITQTDVFVSGTEGYHTYRIPSVVVTNTGTLLAFCEGRKNSGSDTGDIDLLLRRSFDNGTTWQPAQTVWDDGENTCGNPCAVVDRETGSIWLLMTWNSGDTHESRIQPGHGADSRRIFVTRTTDDGESWAQPLEITANTKDESWSWYATGPGAGIQIEHGDYKGRLVIPCDHKVPEANQTAEENGQLEERKNEGGYFSHVIYSDDHGESWQTGGTAPSNQVNECEVVELTDGRLMLNMRNYDRTVHARQVSVSDDGGITWQEVRHDPALIEPVCQASIRRYRWPNADTNSPGVILFSNPASETERTGMTIRASLDDGTTWPHSQLIHAGPSAYSCLVIIHAENGERENEGRENNARENNPQTIGCLFEKDGYQTITFATIDFETIQTLNSPQR